MSPTTPRTVGIELPQVIAILGPTATGKSGLALEVAERIGAEIVNCDSLQVYRGFDIGTAKPTAAHRARIQHHLYDVAEPTERFSAGRYCDLAHPVLEEVSRRMPVVLVGGTGLYFRSLLRGLSAIPPIEGGLRLHLRARFEDEGLTGLRQELEERDPRMAARIAPADSQRILRALEVLESTGRSQATWIDEQSQVEPPWPVRGFALTLERSALYDRIQVRSSRMFDNGWPEEVRTLLDQGVPSSAPAFQALGYRQIVEWLEGGKTREEALSETVAATRRYAKRQMTWFRSEPGLQWLPADQRTQAVQRITESLF